MLFLRGFQYFGAYFAIILGVARKVFSFLMILLIFVISFSHAFYIILRPSEEVVDSNNPFNDDDNNPWNLNPQYYTYFTGSNSLNQDSFIVQKPDGNTNMFLRFGSSLLAMYKFLSGN